MCSFLLTMSDVDGWIAFSDVSNSCEKGKAKYDTNAQKTRVATPCIAPREEGNGNGLATNAIQSVAACLARARERLPPCSQTPVLYPPQCHIEKQNDTTGAPPNAHPLTIFQCRAGNHSSSKLICKLSGFPRYQAWNLNTVSNEGAYRTLSSSN